MEFRFGRPSSGTSTNSDGARASTFRRIKFPQTTGEVLALMQHFGAPTRLLDVTKSPYVAAYFAVEEPHKNDTPHAVWAIDINRLLSGAGQIHMDLGLVRPEDAEESRAAGTLLQFPVETIAGAMASQVNNDGWLNTRVSVVTPYDPMRLSERLSVQQGALLVPRDLSISFMSNLRATVDLDHPSNLRVILLRADQRARALEQLRRMNITRASLFPGLDGFAQSFRQMLIEEPVESRIARLQMRGLMDGTASGTEQAEPGSGIDRATMTSQSRAQP